MSEWEFFELEERRKANEEEALELEDLQREAEADQWQDDQEQMYIDAQAAEEKALRESLYFDDQYEEWEAQQVSGS